MRFLRILAFLVVFATLVAGAGYVALENWLGAEFARPGPAREGDVTVLVERGQTYSSLAPQLEEAGVIHDARALRIAARMGRIDSLLQAGEYTFAPGESLAQVLAKFASGEVITHRITVIEGLTTAQVLRQIEADPLLTGPMPETLPAEGALLADTYTFARGTTRGDMIAMMAAAQTRLLDELWDTRSPDAPVTTREEAIILASVVQKEAAGQDEYPLIAGVFANRLRQGIPLQADATVAYGVAKGEPLTNSRGQRRTLLRSELDTPTPWNTYTQGGLPQTAICNPGRGAIAAVLNPTQTDYLFFVADGTGKHKFAATLAEHNRNVAEFRDYEAREIARERGN